MADEEKTDEKPDEEKAEDKESKPVSLADEARGIRDEILKAKDDLKAENDRKDKAQANELLSGTGGGHVEAKPAVETNQQYVERVRVDRINLKLAEGSKEIALEEIEKEKAKFK